MRIIRSFIFECKKNRKFKSLGVSYLDHQQEAGMETITLSGVDPIITKVENGIISIPHGNTIRFQTIGESFRD